MFDAHLPYLSFSMLEEDEGIDVEITDRYMKDYINAQPLDYDELIEYADTTEPPSYIDELQTYYKKSLTSVSRSLERFVSTLDNHDILDESLIIVVGDHGEEFLEAGIAGHATLYNRNICPGMLVKPPVDADFFVPDEADLIDIYPTISDYVSGDIPNQCAGDSWLRMEPNNTSPRIRVTEAFTGISTYAISVEDRGVKGIFTFDSDIPSRPTLSQLDAGPETKEFIIDTDSMSGNTESSKQELENTAREFVKSRSDKYQRGEEIKLSSEAVERLEELGYK
jgi:arylsulfatase A-like enzyme